MREILDTNIFINSIYDKRCGKAIQKYLKNPLDIKAPSTLINETFTKILQINGLFNKIYTDLENDNLNKKFLDELEKNFSNVYNFLEKSTNNFSNISTLKSILKDRLYRLFVITTKTLKINSCFSDIKEEKEIYSKYTDSDKILKDIEKEIGKDMKHLIIYNEYCNIRGNVGDFVTEDNFNNNQEKIMKILKNLNIINVSQYISN